MPTFETVRFGTLQYKETDVLELRDGLIGLPRLRRWLMLDMEQDLPMRWLQSLDRPDFGVPVMPPLFFADEYEIGAKISSRRQFAQAAAPELVTLIIVNIHPGGEKITGNLRAPLVIDASTRQGAQLALEDDRLSTRQEIDYLKFGLALTGGPADNETPEGEKTTEPAAPPAATAEDAEVLAAAQTVASGN